MQTAAPKSNRKYHIERVGEQPAAALVLLTLALSVIFGFGIRVYFSDKQMKTWVDEAIQARGLDANIQVQEAQLTLADGLFPIFAVDLKKVTGRWAAQCGVSGWWNTDSVRVPLRLFDLLQGKAKVADIRVNFLEVHFEKALADCAAQKSLLVGEKQVVTNPLTPAQVLLGDPPFASQENLVNQERLRALLFGSWSEAQKILERLDTQKLPRLQIAEMRLFAPSTAEVTYVMSQLQVGLEAQDKPVLKARGRLGFLLSEGNAPEIGFTFHLHAEAATLAYDGRWQEGLFSGKIGLERTPEKKLGWFLEGDIRHVSLKNLIVLLDRQKKSLSHIKPRFAWFSCHASGRGLVEDEALTAIVRDCTVKGDLGQIEIRDLKFGSAYPDWLSPYKVDLDQVSLGEVLRALQWRELESLGNYGKIVGEIQVNAADDFSWRGSLQDVSFVFSNLGVQAQQTISEIRGRVDISRDRVTGVFDDVRTSEGGVEGKISFVVERSEGKGHLHLHLTDIELAPRIQKIMFAGKTRGMQLLGDFDYVGGQLVTGRGYVSLEALQAETMEILGARLSWNLDGLKIVIHPALRELRIHRSSQYYQLLLKFLENTKFDGDWMAWNIIGGHLTMEREKVRWKDLHAKMSQKGGLDLKASGGWDAEGILSGGFRVQDGNGTKIWKLRGERDQPSLILSREPIIEPGPQRDPIEGQAAVDSWGDLYQLALRKVLNRGDASP